MREKKLRSDATYLISSDRTDNPKLYARVLANGQESLYLEYYLGYNSVDNKNRITRHKERLKLFLYHDPRTPIERQHNKETLELAKKIRYERGQQMLEQTEGYRIGRKTDCLFFDFCRSYIANYTKKDIRVIEMALSRFETFIAETPKYSMFSSCLRPEHISHDMILDYVHFLKAGSRGEGAHTIFQRFKKVIRYAVNQKIMKTNPCDGITIVIDNNSVKKDVLSQDEMLQLIRTHYRGENPEIRRAFIFCLYTGLRFCDVKTLMYSNVDYSNRMLKYEQHKTAGNSKSSTVVVPLTEQLLTLIGHPSSTHETLIFNLPSNTMCLKALRHWTENAGITKHITWHCARHSFATNILSNGANIKTVASIMGHSNLTYTERYTRAVDKLKEDAMNSLPKIDLE